MNIKERNKLLIEASILLDDIELTIDSMFIAALESNYKH